MSAWARIGLRPTDLAGASFSWRKVWQRIYQLRHTEWFLLSDSSDWSDIREVGYVGLNFCLSLSEETISQEDYDGDND